jgi:hypothetical protein
MSNQLNKAYKWWKMISFHIQSSKWIWIWKSCNHTKLRVKRILSNHDIEVRSNRNLGHFTLHPVQHLFLQAPVAFSHTSLFNTYLLARKLVVFWNLSWSWLYGSWIYNYLCNQCLSPLKCESHSYRGVLDTTEILLKVALDTITVTLAVFFSFLKILTRL